jgi:hypothetical protein
MVLATAAVVGQGRLTHRGRTLRSPPQEVPPRLGMDYRAAETHRMAAEVGSNKAANSFRLRRRRERWRPEVELTARSLWVSGSASTSAMSWRRL